MRVSPYHTWTCLAAPNRSLMVSPTTATFKQYSDRRRKTSRRIRLHLDRIDVTWIFCSCQVIMAMS